MGTFRNKRKGQKNICNQITNLGNSKDAEQFKCQRQINKHYIPRHNVFWFQKIKVKKKS